MKNKVLLFNPKSSNNGRYRVPNSILQVGASIDGLYEYIFVDGNRESDPWLTIEDHLKSGEIKYFGSTVMPGPQLKQAIPFTKKIREEYPEIITIWGGYFASNQYKVCLESDFVDYVINGPGDKAFPRLLQSLEKGEDLSEIENLIYTDHKGRIVKNRSEKLLNQDTLPRLPYQKLNEFYSLDQYFFKTFLGKKTLGYHSSFGCPFTCSFCAVVPIYNARWKGKSAAGIADDILKLKVDHGIDAVEFHDNNFFTSRKRVVEFSKLMQGQNISWWGEGRIDTLDQYTDEDLELMGKSGCKMIFFGAETGDDEMLKQIDKGGKQTGAQILEFAARLKKFKIVPEYSFVLGFPGPDDASVSAQIERDIKFIKKVKEVNPNTEIIIYVYSPVPTEGSDLYKQITEAGFEFPSDLEDWLNPAWENFDLRRNPLTPWLKPEMVDRIRDFETVLNAYHPTVSDFKVTSFQKVALRFFSYFRYKLNWFKYPYELKILQKFWVKYRQPEIEGF